MQHLESINDVVQQITGVAQRETVPDEIVRRAEQVELVDMAPEALRRRMAHGNIYKPEKVDAALGNYFRVGNLTALRELALLWLADKVDEQLDRYRAEHRISATWEARERVVVALTGGPEGDTLIRRAARIAARTKGADLLAVHVSRNDGLAEASARRTWSGSGPWWRASVAPTTRWSAPTSPTRCSTSPAASTPASSCSARQPPRPARAPAVARRRVHHRGPVRRDRRTPGDPRGGRPRPRRCGPGSALTRAPAASPASRSPRSACRCSRWCCRSCAATLSLPSDILLYLGWVVVVALVGGLWPALVAVAVGTLLLNYYFTPPIHKFTIAEHENVLALHRLPRGRGRGQRHGGPGRPRGPGKRPPRAAEAETLSTLAGSVVRGSRVLPALLDQLREAYGFTGVTLLERRAGRAAVTGPATRSGRVAGRGRGR